MNLRRTRTISIKIYETINNLNPEYMKNLFIICIVKLIKRRDNNTTHSAFTCSNLTIGNTKKWCEICSKLTIKTQERRQ